MRKNLRILYIILSLVLLAAMMSRGQSLGIDPGLPDTLVIESVVAFTAGSAVVPIRIVNDETLDAIEITLRHDSPYITLDSFLFTGGRLDYISMKDDMKHDDSTLTIFAFIGSEESIPPGSGSIGNLYLSWADGIPAHQATIDTTTHKIPPYLEWATNFKQDGSDPFVPVIVSGLIDIQTTPFVLDSIWISDTTGYLGLPVTIDVNLYNERNIKRVSVALAYGSGELRYDTVIFEGTRGLSAHRRQVQFNSEFGQLALSLEWDDSNPLPPGSGLLAHLHFIVAEDAPVEPIEIIAKDYLGITTTFIDLTEVDGSLQIYPFFSPGVITIGIPTDVGENQDGLPNQFELGQNYPNPFNPETTITFSLPKSEVVRLSVYNVLGRKVRSLVDRRLPAGQHAVTFDGRSDRGDQLSSGVYYYSLTAGEYKDSSKMLLLK